MLRLSCVTLGVRDFSSAVSGTEHSRRTREKPLVPRVLLCGQWADLWPFYGLYCKLFSLYLKVFIERNPFIFVGYEISLFI